MQITFCTNLIVIKTSVKLSIIFFIIMGFLSLSLLGILMWLCGDLFGLIKYSWAQKMVYLLKTIGFAIFIQLHQYVCLDFVNLCGVFFWFVKCVTSNSKNVNLPSSKRPGKCSSGFSYLSAKINFLYRWMVFDYCGSSILLFLFLGKLMINSSPNSNLVSVEG